MYRYLAVLTLLVLTGAVRGEYLGDPATGLYVNISDDGTFGEITLDGQVIDSGIPQRQFANGQELITKLDGGGVVIGPSAASYTAYIGDSAASDPFAHVFQIDVLSVIRGPLELTTAPNSVFEQYFTFTNLTDTARDLESVAFYASYLHDAADDDIAQQDVPRPIVYSTDAPSGQLVALAARADGYTVKWDVAGPFGIFDGSTPPTTAGLADSTGPVTAANGEPLEMAVGIDAGSVAPGQSVTLQYDYLFSTDMSAPPDNFPVSVPAPGVLALMGFGLVGVRVRRSDHSRPAVTVNRDRLKSTLQ